MLRRYRPEFDIVMEYTTKRTFYSVDASIQNTFYFLTERDAFDFIGDRLLVIQKLIGYGAELRYEDGTREIVYFDRHSELDQFLNRHRR